jgi:hypothetical protein
MGAAADADGARRGLAGRLRRDTVGRVAASLLYFLVDVTPGDNRAIPGPKPAGRCPIRRWSTLR